MSGRKRIVVDGVEYESVEAMPPDARRTYELTLRLLEEGEGGLAQGLAGPGDLETHTVEIHDATTRIVVDGKEYSGVGEMPPEARALYRRITGGDEAGAAATVAPGNPFLAEPEGASSNEEIRRALREAEPRPAPASWLNGALTGALVMAILFLLALLLYQA